MMKILIAGTIAGLFSGVLALFLTLINNAVIGLPHIYSTASIIPIQNIAINEILLGVIWGIIFSIFYSILYDSIPGQGVSKGLVYSMIVLLFSHIRWVPYNVYYGFAPSGLTSAYIGFLMFATYGLLLGHLYKPPK